MKERLMEEKTMITSRLIRKALETGKIASLNINLNDDGTIEVNTIYQYIGNGEVEKIDVDDQVWAYSFLRLLTYSNEGGYYND